MPEHLVQLPGSKAWLMGVARMGKELVPYINLSHFLSLPIHDKKNRPSGAPVLIMKDASGSGSLGLKVDVIVDFISTHLITDDGDSNYFVPVGLGSCLYGTVRTKERTWALIDLTNILNDPKLQKIDLS
jgi:chemotaxis signal transduction protein